MYLGYIYTVAKHDGDIGKVTYHIQSKSLHTYRSALSCIDSNHRKTILCRTLSTFIPFNNDNNNFNLTECLLQKDPFSTRHCKIRPQCEIFITYKEI